MTTPPTPAGWYSDPDGSGGQRYWDGTIWTEHRSPAAPVAPPPAPAPTEPAEPAASEQPTAIVQLRPAPTDAPAGGAHRRPDPEDEAEPEPAPEPVAEPEPEPVAQPEQESEPAMYTGTTEPVTQAFTPKIPTFAPDAPPSAPPPSGPPPSGPFPSAPLYDASAPEPPAPSGNRGLVTMYIAACAALLAVLVGVAIYGFVIKEDPGVQIASPGDTTTEASEPSESPDAPSQTEGPGWGGPSETPTDSPTAPAATGDAIDGTLSFTIHGVEVGPTVVSSQDFEQTAVGEYIVVHMTLTNTGTEVATFVGLYQKLLAGGTTYNIDDVATAYLDGTFADVEPGASADVSIAFDVPPGTPAEAIELHADPSTPGTQVPLS